MPYYNELIDQTELLEFSQALNVSRPNYLGSRLFPDQKTQYIEQEYSRLAENGNLPQVAMVHAYDTEAHIGSRVPFEKVSVDQLLIKEKINQTEKLQRMFRGMRMDDVRNFVFDDVARLAENVIARAEKAKIDAISTGKFTIKENGLSMNVDYGIPEENMVSVDWSDEDADILGDIDRWRTMALDKGAVPNRAVTTEAVVSKMKRNKGLQAAINGTGSVGAHLSLAQVNNYLQEHYGFTVEVYEQRYAVPSKNDQGKTVLTSERFFPADKFVMLSLGVNGAMGTGLWGVTPEEMEQGGAFDSKRQQQFVTVAQWTDKDPVAVWTKASGLFVPVFPNVHGHIIADVSGSAATQG